MGKIADVLRETKRRIEMYGWLPRSGLQLKDSPGCIFDHVIVSNGRGCVPIGVDNLLKEVTGEFHVSEWNDRQTSVEPVLAAVTRAIELAEARGL